MNTEHFDVIIMGAGLSGVGAGVHLKRDCPGHSFAILEGREAMGGTWDLFRYPGVRSDSDMYTLGYAFRPWTDAKSIADGETILSYIQTVSREHGIDQHIRYAHRIKSAAWSSTEASPYRSTKASNALWMAGSKACVSCANSLLFLDAKAL